MNVDVGKDYIRQDDTRKRPIAGVIWSFIWIVILVAWVWFLTWLCIRDDEFRFAFSKDMFGTIFLCSIPTAIFVIGILCTIKYEKRERTIEYRIHEYERWDRKESMYDTYYVVENISLYSTYWFYKHTADWIDPMDANELEEHCFDLTDTWYGYKTQEIAMNSILEDIKYFIAQDNAKKNVKIRNIKTMETFTVTELKQQFAEGKFNHIKDKKGK